MAGRVYLHVDVSDVAIGDPGCGWVVATDAVVAHGGAIGPMDDVVERAFSFALNRFPGADEIVVGSNRSEVLEIPWGRAAREEAIVGFDRTGVARILAARGVDMVSRWLPNDAPGIRADTFMAGASRAIANEASYRDVPTCETEMTQGWRTRLLAGIGGTPLNHVLAEKGLGRTACSAFLGIPSEDVERHVRTGELALGPTALVTYATAIRLRDRLEAEGVVDWGPEDLGGSDVAALREPADATLCVSDVGHAGSIGVGVALCRDGVRSGWARRFLHGDGPARPECLRAALVALSYRLEDLAGCRTVDVLTTDPWLAKVMAGSSQRVPGRVAEAAESLRASACAAGIALRPSCLRIPYARTEPVGEVQSLARASALMARAAQAGATAAYPPSVGTTGAGSLLDACERRAAELRTERAPQREVAVRVLRGCGVDEGHVQRFDSLVADTVAAYPGISLDLPRFLPWPMEGRIAALYPVGCRPVREGFSLPGDLPARWADWHRRYARLRERNPVLRLREMVLRVDPALDLSTWTERKHVGLMMWIQGACSGCPFDIVPEDRPEFEREMLALVAECGGWPFSPPGTSKVVLRPELRTPPPTHDRGSHVPHHAGSACR